MKYGKVLTYKDAEEARKLIGKKVVGSYCLSKIENYPEKIEPEILTGIDDELDFIFKAGDYYGFQFIREIIEDEPQRMNKRQIAEWCGRGFGQYRYTGDTPSRTDFSPFLWEENQLVENGVKIRPWSSNEWIEPTVDIYERDCKGDTK